MSKSRKTIILATFILLKFLLQYYLVSPDYDLQRDEYLHLDQANFPAWGYLSVPPVTSWISFLIRLLGNSVFWVRFFPALFGALTIWVVWKTIEALKGDLFALVLGAGGLLFSALLRLNLLYQPNSLDILCWASFYYVNIRYINSGNSKWLFAGALVFAVGFLNKYNFVFLLAGLFPAVLLTRQRTVFVHKKFLAALGLGLLLILPNLMWQYNNGFPVLHHMKVLADTQLVHVDRMTFFREQLMFFLGSVLVILFGLYALLFYPSFEKYRAFFWTFVCTLLIFVLLKAKGYYAIGLYPVYIAFGSVYLSVVLKAGWKRYLKPALAVLPVILFIPVSQVLFPNKSPEYIVNNPGAYSSMGLLRWEDGKEHRLPQDFADMLGWRELARKVDSLYSAMPDPDKTLVLCDNYGQAGAINYYSTKNIRAVSFNADYIDWFDFTVQYKHLLRIKTAGDFNNEMADTSPYFQQSALADSISNPYAREFGTAIFVFTNAGIDINSRVKEEIAETKKIWQRPGQ